ncbi:UNKNOWN [Stylonychia lemnae]|uniref:Uncharacterized protein n=1 Tax=Stylonychia lemnae TaxID=5949 RepID=A0A078AIK3_STYLE|nr:UNKNOWN [Stylonychia lemnae]|eukprot:CDW81766.1 UNKNOWN [Stylonychia lemnae]
MMLRKQNAMCAMEMEIIKMISKSINRQPQKSSIFLFLLSIHRKLLILQRDSSKQEELQSECEQFTKNATFQQWYDKSQDPSFKKAYQQIWLDYSVMVRDSDKVIEYMIQNKIGHDDAKVYIQLAYFYEKYQREFKKTQQIYISAIEKKLNEKFTSQLIQKYREFSERMQRRTERDVIIKIGELQFKDVVQNKKKRKLEEIYDNLNESLDSNASSSSKKRRIKKEIESCHEKVQEYQDGIEYLRMIRPEAIDMNIAEQTLKELESKPLSWISKMQTHLVDGFSHIISDQDSCSNFNFSVSNIDIQKNITISQQSQDKQQSKIRSGDISDINCQIQNLPYTSQQDAQSKNQIIQKYNQIPKGQHLEVIGETSQEGFSSNSITISKSLNNVTALNHHQNNQNRKSQQAEESKGGIDDTNLFKSAHNSFQQLDLSYKKPPNDFKVEMPSVNQIPQNQNQNSLNFSEDTMRNNLQNLLQGNLAQVDINSLIQQLNMLQSNTNNNNGNQGQNQLQYQNKNQGNQQHSRSQFELPQKQNNSQQQLGVPVTNKSQENGGDQNQGENRRRISGMFMNIFEQDQMRQSIGAGGSVSQFNISPMPDTNNNRPTLMQQNANIQNQNQSQFDYSNIYNNNNQSNNVSFLDVTPVDNKFTRNLNPNYSQELILKKRTLSNGGNLITAAHNLNARNLQNNIYFNDNESQNQQPFQSQLNPHEKQIMSPFGIVSPINCKSNTRNSNIAEKESRLNMLPCIPQPNFQRDNNMNGVYPNQLDHPQRSCQNQENFQPSPNFGNQQSINQPQQKQQSSSAISSSHFNFNIPNPLSSFGFFQNFSSSNNNDKNQKKQQNQQQEYYNQEYKRQSSNNNAKMQNESMDSDNFKDCFDTSVQDIGGVQQRSNQLATKKSVPSALKGNVQVQVSEDINSRTGSKSVRFIGN